MASEEQKQPLPRDWRVKATRCYERETHLGKIYVNIAYDDTSKLPSNAFAYAQGGPCFISEAEAIGRLLNLCTRYHVPIKEIIEQLSEIQCEPHWDNGNLVKSIADAIAQCLAQGLEDGYPEEIQPLADYMRES